MDLDSFVLTIETKFEYYVRFKSIRMKAVAEYQPGSKVLNKVKVLILSILASLEREMVSFVHLLMLIVVFTLTPFCSVRPLLHFKNRFRRQYIIVNNAIPKKAFIESKKVVYVLKIA